MILLDKLIKGYNLTSQKNYTYNFKNRFKRVSIQFQDIH